jgi:GATA-binding protein
MNMQKFSNSNNNNIDLKMSTVSSTLPNLDQSTVKLENSQNHNQLLTTLPPISSLDTGNDLSSTQSIQSEQQQQQQQQQQEAQLSQQQLSSDVSSDDNSKKELDHIVPNAKTTTTTQSNGATTTKQNMTIPTCKNCKTQTTPLWRRDETGQVLCNACGLFLKLHGRPRPISLKSDVIKSRNRVKHSNKSSPNTPELKAKDSNNVSINNQNGNLNISGQLNNNGNINNLNGSLNNKISSKFLPKQYKPNSKTSKSRKQNKSDNLLKDQQNKNNKNNKLKTENSNIHQTNQHVIQNQQLNSITSPNLLPLLPRGQLSQNLPPGTPYTYASTTAWLNKSQGTNIQSLHYPSSTPTQFVSNLNRITSPLLLSTSTPPKLNPTPSQSQSSERSSSVNGNNIGNNNNNNNTNNVSTNNLNRDAVLNAAGALEILSQQASSNSNSNSNSNSTDYIPGMKLNSPRSISLSKPNSLVEKLPPISLLTSKENEIKSNIENSEPTHLHNILSPSQFNESNLNIKSPSPMISISRNLSSTTTDQSTSLPPIKSLTSPLLNDFNAQISQQQLQQRSSNQASPMINPYTHLPPLKNVPGISSVIYNDNINNNNNTNEVLDNKNININNINTITNNNNNNNNNQNSDVSLLNINNNTNNLQEENERLRTRINELELVNDIYKTRITELEEVDNKFRNSEINYLNKIKELETSLNIYRQSQMNSKMNLNGNIDYSTGDKRQSDNDEKVLEKRIKVES